MYFIILSNRHFLYWAVLVFLLSALILGGCTGTYPQDQVPQPNLIATVKPRRAALTFETARVPQLVTGNTELAFDLYRSLYNLETNLVLAPQSLSTSLAMAYAGAREETRTQMANVLHFEMPESQLHPAFNALEQALTDSEPDRYTTSNAFLGSQDVAYRRPFLDTLAEYYGTGIQTLNFGVSEQARQTINQWASDGTEGQIPEILPITALQENTSLVLANAVRFDANWAQAFNPENTREAGFTLLDGSIEPVSMMNGAFDLLYTQVGEISAIELPYEGESTSLLILLPEIDSFENTVAELNSQTLNSILETLAPTQVQVSLPRFQVDSIHQMKEPLMALGMVDAFGEADFSGIDGTRELFLDEVYHQVLIKVDADGARAASGSAIVVSSKGNASPDAIFNANHPFIFLIRDVESGAVLFLGHLLNPES